MRYSDRPRSLTSLDYLSLIVAVYFAISPATVYGTNQMPAELVCIANKESSYHQFDRQGNPLISPTGDVGVMQLNMKTWLPLAKKLNLDIVNNPRDNIVMGIYLYNTEGGHIWTTDKYCNGNA